jgi:hypothetical protein
VTQCLVPFELVAICRLVQYKTFAVGTEGFLLPVFPDSGATAKGDDISSWRGVLLVQLLGLSGSACRHKSVHLLHHGVHVCFVCCLYLHDLLCMLVLQHCKQHCLCLPCSLAAAVSCASNAASLNHNCFVVIAKYCFCSSHFSVKYVWSATHVCAIVPLFSKMTIWSSVNISNRHICAPAAIVFSSLLVAILRLSSKTWKQSGSLKYAVMLVVGSQGVLYLLFLYSYFCAVIILIAVFRCRWSVIASTVVLPKTNILLFEGGNCVVANSVQDEFLPHLFNVQVIPVTLLLDFVLHHKLFAQGCRFAGIEGICGVCSWVGRYRMGPGGIANDEPVLAFGDYACQMAVLLPLSVVMGLQQGEDFAELVLKFVDGLRSDYAAEACQFVLKVDELVVCFVRC